MANIHQVWSQELDNGTTGTFGIDDGGRVYWNGNPLVTEERVKLQGWVNAAIFLLLRLRRSPKQFFCGPNLLQQITTVNERWQSFFEHERY
ncbi:hypothetical protein ACFS07_36300 [Undibacterium arcticum]